MVRIWREVILFGTAVLLISINSEDVGECKEGEWRCGDRSCAGVGAACDGTLQCADGSDEALLLCRGTQRPLLGLILLCSQSWEPGHAALCPEACREWPEYCYYAMFAEQGTPGTCILPPFPSPGAYSITDITQRGGGPADFSLTYSCPTGYRLVGKHPRCVGGNWTDSFPSCVPASSSAVSGAYADGKHTCSEEQFSCGDGACVRLGHRCDGTPHCADGSDERACADRSTPKMCMLPEYPGHGTYTVLDRPHAAPGQEYELALLTVICNPGYGVEKVNIAYCYRGAWTPMPRCSRLCELIPHISVNYECMTTENNVTIESRSCSQLEPEGTIVRPECRSPDYNHDGILELMHCKDGSWDYVAVCEKECGRLVPDNTSLRTGARVPWQASIFKKTQTLYERTCGGSLVSTTVVISAAHCFWNEWEKQQYPASNYAVALGKIYPTWDDVRDEGQQKFDVRDVKIPALYEGAKKQYADDIAVVILDKAAEYQIYVHPVCIDFDVDLDRKQIEDDKKGEIAGWGPKDGKDAELKFLELSTLPISECVTHNTYRPKHMTSDKFCAGFIYGDRNLCFGDDGGGLAFPEPEGEVEHYYLRGVATTFDGTVEYVCSTLSVVLFTMVSRHERFIKEHLFGRRHETMLCRFPTSIPNGSVSVDGEIDLVHMKASHGSDLRFTCDKGYDLVGKSSVLCQFGTWTDEPPTCVRTAKDRCVLPRHPHYGTYIVPGKNQTQPGDHFEDVHLYFTCDDGTRLLGTNEVTCHQGKWSSAFPTCEKLCKLNAQFGVNYTCTTIQNNVTIGSRPCSQFEPKGTVVRPECLSPDYYSASVLQPMHCVDGSWDYVAVCMLECGRVTPTSLDIEGSSTKQRLVPWHAGIHKKNSGTYEQICGGSLVRADTVISAAHCFWSDDQRRLYPASNYTVSLGKIRRNWGDDRGEESQLFGVRDVKIPMRYLGEHTMYQADISLVFLDKPAQYHPFVRPVCIDFDVYFDRMQLEDGKKGKILSLTGTRGNLFPELRVMELPSISIIECIRHVPFRQFFTSDKFCAGYWDGGKALCKGDSGGGLSFPTLERSVERYYLRGVASVVIGPALEDHCSYDTITAFTSILRHEQFLRKHLMSENEEAEELPWR